MRKIWSIAVVAAISNSRAVDGEFHLRGLTRMSRKHKSRILSDGHVSSALAACITKYVEPRMSPKEQKQRRHEGRKGRQGSGSDLHQAGRGHPVGPHERMEHGQYAGTRKLLQASFVTNTSCYVKYVENRIPPVGTEALKPLAEKAGKEPNPPARPAKNGSLDEEHEWSTRPSTGVQEQPGESSSEEG